MDKKQRRRLQTMLAGLDNGERLRLTRRATKLRKAALRTQKPGARRPELDEFLLELLGAELDGPDGGDGDGQVATGPPTAAASAGDRPRRRHRHRRRRLHRAARREPR